MTDASGKSRLLVIGLGGTIAMAGSGEVTPTLSAQQLVDAVPGLRADGFDVPPGHSGGGPLGSGPDAVGRDATGPAGDGPAGDGLGVGGLGVGGVGAVGLEVHSLRNLPGAWLTLDDLAAVLRLIEERDPAGTVVLQGTDTIEETAYVLDLLHSGPRPIVVTGAMRNPTLAGADGPANILAAVRVAASPLARDLGCVVVMADEIHAAARVRKQHTMSVAAFGSPAGGPLGYVAEGRVHVLQRPVGRCTLPPLPAGFRPPRVGLYTATLGDDGALLPDLAARLDGLVVAGFGVGHVPATWPTPLAEIATRLPVVLASRIGAGFTASGTYGFPGSERDLRDRGLIPAGHLDPYKSRLLLQLALLHGASRPELADAFAVAGGLDPHRPWPWRSTAAPPA